MTDAREALLLHIRREYGTQKAFADHYGISPAFVSTVLKGGREIPKAWLDEIGFEKCVTRTVTYRREKK